MWVGERVDSGCGVRGWMDVGERVDSGWMDDVVRVCLVVVTRHGVGDCNSHYALSGGLFFSSLTVCAVVRVATPLLYIPLPCPTD